MASSDPTLSSILNGEGSFVRTDEPVEPKRFQDKPIDQGLSFSKYIEFNGRTLELNKESDYFSSPELTYPIEDGEAKFKLIFGTSLLNYQIQAMDPTESITVLDRDQVSSTLVEGERYPITDGDYVYIGDKKFRVTTRDSLEGSRLRSLRLILES